MFDQLSDKLGNVFRNMRGLGKINEENIAEAVKAVKMALLEADVDYKVVKSFIEDVRKRAIGQDVVQSVMPDQQFIQIVNDELSSLMGSVSSAVHKASAGPTLIMMVGIQGSGKTTVTAKLARHFQKEGKRCLLVACDVYRPAAIKQLKVLGEQAKCEVYADENKKSPVKIAADAMRFAQHHSFDYILVDTAGRLEVDQQLMEELREIKVQVKPHEILYVADAMMGQSGIQVAKQFDEQVGIDGVVLTKLDGDARGGVALSIKSVLGRPIKFVGVGEKLRDLEPFYPDRMASRILGMGDIVSLVEKAKQNFNEGDAIKLEKKIKKKGLDLNDLLEQLRQIRKMGSLKDILAMMPGAKQLKDVPVDDKQLVRVEAIINSMTPHERAHPYVINGSRRKRISQGSGTSSQDVNRVLKQLDTMNKMMKKLTKGGKGGMAAKLSKMGGFPF